MTHTTRKKPRVLTGIRHPGPEPQPRGPGRPPQPPPAGRDLAAEMAELAKWYAPRHGDFSIARFAKHRCQLPRTTVKEILAGTYQWVQAYQLDRIYAARAALFHAPARPADASNEPEAPPEDRK